MTTAIEDPRDNGWRMDLEDRAFLKSAFRTPVPKEFRAYGRPEEVRPDLDGSHVLEDQGQMGSCQGCTISSCVERLNFIATGGDKTQLSKLFAYLATQKIDGLLGRDAGSTISGGMKLATGNGICPETVVPYPKPVAYPNRRDIARVLTPENYAAGEPFKVRSAVGIRSNDDMLDWIGGGGAGTIGIPWPIRMRTEGRVRYVDDFVPLGNQGHALAILGYLKNGWTIWANSHNYWMHVSPKALEKMLRNRRVSCGGVSDMASPKPREVNFTQGKLAAWVKRNRELIGG